MKEIYISLAEWLKQEIPELQHVDLFNEQFRKSGKQQPFLFPAVMVEFRNLMYTDHQQGIQKVSGGLVLHIACESYADSFEGSEDQDDALRVLDFKDQVYKAVQRFDHENLCAALSRRSEVQDTNHNMIYVFEMDFNLVFWDFTNYDKADYIPVNVDFHINKHINKQL